MSWPVLGLFFDRDRGQVIFLDGILARVKPTIGMFDVNGSKQVIASGCPWIDTPQYHQ
jgi:hypothetical protein